AQLSASKLALILLFAQDNTEEKQKEILTELEAIVKNLTLPQARRDALIVMGNACLMYKIDDEKALRYLMDAEADITSTRLKADILIHIGSTAQKLKKKDIAIKYYQAFVNTYKRDGRNFLVREKIAELKSGS